MWWLSANTTNQTFTTILTQFFGMTLRASFAFDWTVHSYWRLNVKPIKLPGSHTHTQANIFALFSPSAIHLFFNIVSAHNVNTTLCGNKNEIFFFFLSVVRDFSGINRMYLKAHMWKEIYSGGGCRCSRCPPTEIHRKLRNRDWCAWAHIHSTTLLCRHVFGHSIICNFNLIRCREREREKHWEQKKREQNHMKIYWTRSRG